MNLQVLVDRERAEIGKMKSLHEGTFVWAILPIPPDATPTSFPARPSLVKWSRSYFTQPELLGQFTTGRQSSSHQLRLLSLKCRTGAHL